MTVTSSEISGAGSSVPDPCGGSVGTKGTRIWPSAGVERSCSVGADGVGCGTYGTYVGRGCGAYVGCEAAARGVVVGAGCVVAFGGVGFAWAVGVGLRVTLGFGCAWRVGRAAVAAAPEPESRMGAESDSAPRCSRRRGASCVAVRRGDVWASVAFDVGDVRPSRCAPRSLRSGAAPVPVAWAVPRGTSTSAVVSAALPLAAVAESEDSSAEGFLKPWDTTSRRGDGPSHNSSESTPSTALFSDHSGPSTPVESAVFSSSAARGLMWGLLYTSRAEPVMCSWEELRETNEAVKLAVPPMMMATLAAEASFNPVLAAANLEPKEAVDAASFMEFSEITGECGLGDVPTNGVGELAPLASARAAATAAPAVAAARAPAVFKNGEPLVVSFGMKRVRVGVPLSAE